MAITRALQSAVIDGMGIPFRNRIINGAFDIFQRASAATNVTSGAAGYTGPDRFFVYQNGTVSVQTSQNSTTVPSGFRNCLQWGRPAAQTNAGVTALGQVLETYNSIDFQGQYATISFYAKAGANFSSSANAFAVNVYTGTGTDDSAANLRAGSWAGSTAVISQTVTLTTSWQRFTITSAAPLGATIKQLGLMMSWTPYGTAGADDYVYITGIQLEVGGGSPFERRPYAQELVLCQRYYEVMYSQLDTAQNGTSYSYATWFYKAMKRASPTISLGAGSTVTGTNYAGLDGYQAYTLNSALRVAQLTTSSAEL